MPENGRHSRPRSLSGLTGNAGHTQLTNETNDMVLDVKEVAEDTAEIGDQMVEVARLEELKGPPVDLQDADSVRALLHLGRIGMEVIAKRGDPVAPPVPEEGFDLAEILQPERNRCKLEHRGVVAVLDERKGLEHGALSE